jgi:hypothetical protein
MQPKGDGGDSVWVIEVGGPGDYKEMLSLVVDSSAAMSIAFVPVRRFEWLKTISVIAHPRA